MINNKLQDIRLNNLYQEIKCLYPHDLDELNDWIRDLYYLQDKYERTCVNWMAMAECYINIFFGDYPCIIVDGKLELKK